MQILTYLLKSQIHRNLVKNVSRTLLSTSLGWNGERITFNLFKRPYSFNRSVRLRAIINNLLSSVLRFFRLFTIKSCNLFYVSCANWILTGFSHKKLLGGADTIRVRRYLLHQTLLVPTQVHLGIESLVQGSFLLDWEIIWNVWVAGHDVLSWF